MIKIHENCILVLVNIKTRIVSIEDAPIIAFLARITFDETFGHLFRDRQDLLDYFENTFSVDKIETSISKSNNIFWIAYVDKLPVGYAKLKLNSTSQFIISKNVCQLQKIYVLKDFLSLKIGHKLQGIQLQKAKELGFKHIWLSVLNSNERAINFYIKNGFKHIGDHDFQIGKEEFEFKVMSRTL